MTNLKRIGDFFEEGEKTRTGEHRVLQAAENLAAHIFFFNVEANPKYYIQQRPLVEPEIVGLPPDVTELGEYEITLLGKLLQPTSPVICVQGAIGAGKTTTINYLTNHILRRMEPHPCIPQGSTPINAGRLMALIDFKNFEKVSQQDRATQQVQAEELVNMLCQELWARGSSLITEEKEEYFDFWQQLIDHYDQRTDREVDNVARVLLAEAPWLRQAVDEPSEQEVERRRSLREKLRKQNIRWYLRYLILLWRHLIQTQFAGKRGCALVILDNVDTLAPNLQRMLVDFVLRNSSQDGPTFVVLMRPETLKRQGLADTLIEVVQHKGPAPVDVVMDRLRHFCEQPENYFQLESGLTKKQAQLIETFLQGMQKRMTTDQEDVFSNFMKHAAGNSVRLALILAQGLLMVRINDMKNPNLSPHFLVRACIRLGSRQFKADLKHPINNPFHVINAEEGRFLIKPRILRFIAGRNNQSGLSNIRSTFTLFGYPEESIKKALNEMLRNECQLLRSDGLDIYRETWGDEQETMFLTAIGKGYAEHLIYSMDFVQEVMLDCYISDPGRWPKILDGDLLTEKLRLLHLFLRELHETDAEEVDSFIDRQGAIKYVDLFGRKLLSLDLIEQIYLSAGRILYNVARKYPHYQPEYKELLDQFTSLVRVAEKKNRDLIGVSLDTIDAITLSN